MAAKLEKGKPLKIKEATKRVLDLTKKVKCRPPMFETDWEEFVIRKDQATGRLVALFACCAGATV